MSVDMYNKVSFRESVVTSNCLCMMKSRVLRIWSAVEIQQKKIRREVICTFAFTGAVDRIQSITNACKRYAVKSSNENQLQIVALLFIAFSADFVPGDYVTIYQIDPYC